MKKDPGNTVLFYTDICSVLLRTEEKRERELAMIPMKSLTDSGSLKARKSR